MDRTTALRQGPLSQYSNFPRGICHERIRESFLQPGCARRRSHRKQEYELVASRKRHGSGDPEQSCPDELFRRRKSWQIRPFQSKRLGWHRIGDIAGCSSCRAYFRICHETGARTVRCRRSRWNYRGQPISWNGSEAGSRKTVVPRDAAGLDSRGAADPRSGGAT